MSRTCSICKKNKSEGVSLFSLPTNEGIRGLWLESLGIETSNENTRVCSDHFHKKFLITDNRGYHLTDRHKAIPFRPGADDPPGDGKQLNDEGTDINYFISDDSCRLCLTSSKRDMIMYSIFGCIRNISICELIFDALNITVSETDKLSNVCEKCLSKLDVIYGIRREFDLNEKKYTAIMNPERNEEPIEEMLLIEEHIDDPTIYEEVIEEFDINDLDVIEEVTTETSELEPAEIMEDKSPDKSSKSLCCYICHSTRIEFDENSLEEHLETHAGLLPFNCEKCNSNLILNLKALNSHMSFHDENRAHVCGCCGKRYEDANKLKRHQNSHYDSSSEQGASFKCSLCAKEFSSHDLLVSHEHTHSKSTCHVCGKEFSNKHNLKRHLLVHTGEKPFTCTYCDKAFNQENALKEHIIYRHTEEKKFQCDLCKVNLKSKKYLQTHKKTKCKGVPKFIACRICGKNVESETLIYEHFSKEHSENIEELIRCEVCEQYFQDDYTHHMHKYTHRPDFSCLHCDKKLRNAASLSDHENSHTGDKPHICHICKKAFGQLVNLVRHAKLHSGLKPFKCEFCEKSFALMDTCKIHRRVHTGEKPYECDICLHRFTDGSSLIKHKKRHK